MALLGSCRQHRGGLLLYCVGHNRCAVLFYHMQVFASLPVLKTRIIWKSYPRRSFFTLMPMLQHGLYLLCNICSGDHKESDGI